MLAKIAHKVHPMNARMLAPKLLYLLERPVGRAIIHQNEFNVITRKSVKDLKRQVDDFSDCMLRVIAGYNNRNQFTLISHEEGSTFLVLVDSNVDKIVNMLEDLFHLSYVIEAQESNSNGFA